ncbi:MAG TPA: hypothetical protein VNX17_03910 [Edaphobacter sp.]|nr:hypothetical protein [Edaphobacter sp.]
MTKVFYGAEESPKAKRRRRSLRDDNKGTNNSKGEGAALVGMPAN